MDAFHRRDTEAFLALFDPDVEFSPVVLRMGGGPLSPVQI
jgi:hypothetical protein